MDYKVCILAAGRNDKVSYTKIINNALLPVGDTSALSAIIEKFPPEIEIVIPVGYNAQQIKDFIMIVHTNRNISFIEVDNWDGPGAGPGYSLLCCKKKLQCPFIFTSCDTIVMEDVPLPDKNWIGVASVTDSKNFCIAEVFNNLVRTFYDKVETHVLLKTCLDYRTILSNAFIGMAGVNNYEEFWNALETNKNDLINNELQVSNGLNRLIDLRLHAIPFTWFDVGHQVGYEYTNRHFEKNRVLRKEDEFIYFEKNLVIKYFNDVDVIKKRIQRAKLLKGYVPTIFKGNTNFYAYKKIPGKTLSEVIDNQLFIDMLEFYKDNLWVEKKLTNSQKAKFKNACLRFYKSKTEMRIEKFYQKSNVKENEEIINGIKIPRLSELMKKIDWGEITSGIPVLYHGDFQPENIIITDEGKYILIDWRQDFDGIIEYGDIYYDFAKMQHALIMSGEIIRRNQFEIVKKGNDIKFFFLIKSNLTDYYKIFRSFIMRNNYDMKKINILTGLIYLNIAALHHKPYDLLLYYLGKTVLYEQLQGG